MKLFRLLPALAGALALSACAMPWEVSEVQSAKSLVATGGTPFTQALTEEYKAQAAYEADVEQEWRHALIFSRKAVRAAAGEVVQPEDLASWDVPAAALPALSSARAKLVADFDAGARECRPALAAKAQAALDCWLEEEWEGDADATCKTAFFDTEPKLKGTAKVERKITKTFTVYFDFNKSDINAQAKKSLAEAIKAVAEVQPVEIFVAGHTDTVGASAYNLRLSQRRAEAVSAALTKAGIKNTVLDVKYYGKTQPAVPTKDNVKEAKNRRAEILFETETTVNACER